MKRYTHLLLICLFALILRLALLIFVEHPGIGDPNHYYNLALRLINGQGFTIDYIWQFYNPPATLVHPEDFWMPFSAVLAAIPMQLTGNTSVPVAVLPFTLLGSLLPVCAYWAARQLGCGKTTSLFAAGAAAVLPEFVLNSVRTDTTIPNTLFLAISILALTEGLRQSKGWLFLLSGIAAGLAYLTRGDNLLLVPMFVVTVVIYTIMDRQQIKKNTWHLLLVPVVALIIASPWLIRNIQVGGSPVVPNLSRLFFLVDFRDHYAYGRDFNFQTLLEAQSITQIVAKRLFEMAASIKTMYITLDVFLPVIMFGGLVWLMITRDRQRLLTLAPAIILLGGSYVFYTTLAPIANQGGSFKKSYLSLVPLLIPLGAYLLETAIPRRQILVLVCVLGLGFTAANAVEMVRSDIRFVGTYLQYMQTVADAARELGDANDDEQIILMAQDPFMLRFFDIQSVVIPMEDRDTILEVAQRYQVDYLMMPPARPALDPLFEKAETDPRFVPLVDLPAINVELYGFDFEAD